MNFWLNFFFNENVV